MIFFKKVNGNWGEWSPFGSCEDTSLQGTTRIRSCDDPSAKNGGDECTGASVENCNGKKFMIIRSSIIVLIIDHLMLKLERSFYNKTRGL